MEAEYQPNPIPLPDPFQEEGQSSPNPTNFETDPNPGYAIDINQIGSININRPLFSRFLLHRGLVKVKHHAHTHRSFDGGGFREITEET